ncbi:PREDICTED: uncharacterized protein LOC109115703 [Nelumbo nucifera]|uniref:Uncharacterized protein LOC109115703 n=1 Tax=Nelumbo nucifera TaxID=4432 RepID=A0A1U8QAA1_NELNU|nr:PREDICTED: uncharacterized protein LOC109115703 [Nelumbo nucifera]
MEPSKNTLTSTISFSPNLSYISPCSVSPSNPQSFVPYPSRRRYLRRIGPFEDELSHELSQHFFHERGVQLSRHLYKWDLSMPWSTQLPFLKQGIFESKSVGGRISFVISSIYGNFSWTKIS